MQRYKDQHIEEYKKKHISTKLVRWDSLDTNTRRKTLDKMVGIGWFGIDFPLYTAPPNKEFRELIRCLRDMRYEYFTLDLQIPPIEEMEIMVEEEQQDDLSQSLENIFLSEDLIFYDFISLYINTLTETKRNRFTRDLNNFFTQLGVNKVITKNSIIPRQSDEIQKRIIEPTFELLASDSYAQINQELEKGIKAHTKKEYDSFILCSINALKSTLEYLATGKISQKKQKFDKLIKDLTNKKGGITEHTSSLLKNINSYLEIERKNKTKAHTSSEEATEQEAIFVFNLVMSAIQFLILNESN